MKFLKITTIANKKIDERFEEYTDVDFYNMNNLKLLVTSKSLVDNTTMEYCCRFVFNDGLVILIPSDEIIFQKCDHDGFKKVGISFDKFVGPFEDYIKLVVSFIDNDFKNKVFNEVVDFMQNKGNNSLEYISEYDSHDVPTETTKLEFVELF